MTPYLGINVLCNGWGSQIISIIALHNSLMFLKVVNINDNYHDDPKEFVKYLSSTR